MIGEKFKKTILGICIFTCAGVFMAVNIFASSISDSQLKNIENTDVMTEVAGIVLSDSNYEGGFTADEVGKIEVYMYDLTGDGKEDAIVSVFFGPKSNITSVYENKGGIYDYRGTLGEFFSPSDINVQSLNSEDYVIFVSDYINQQIGAFEKETYLYGYVWDEKLNDYKTVFADPLDIEAQWLQDGIWKKVVREGSYTYDNSSVPNIKTTYNQEYYTYSDEGNKRPSKDEDYNIADSWQENETYYWSDEWSRFIVGEKIEKSTGEKVAIISRWNKLPYSRTPEFQPYNNVERILRKDGKAENVNKDTLTEIENKVFNTIKST